MFFTAKKSRKQQATEALSVNKDEVKSKLAKMTDVSKQLETVVLDASEISKACVKRLKKDEDFSPSSA